MKIKSRDLVRPENVEKLFHQKWEQFILIVSYLYWYQTGNKGKNKSSTLGKHECSLVMKLNNVLH